MAVLDIFSKRQRRARGDVPDVLLGGPIPSAFRAQVIPIWRDVWGPGPSHNGVRLPPQPSCRACVPSSQQPPARQATAARA